MFHSELFIFEPFGFVGVKVKNGINSREESVKILCYLESTATVEFLLIGLIAVNIRIILYLFLPTRTTIHYRFGTF